MKKVVWLGNSRARMRALPKEVTARLGKSLRNVQAGLRPADWKPFSEVGLGVIEVRVHTPSEFRLFYTANFPEAISVLHVFEKKSQKTDKRDITIARERYAQLQQIRQEDQEKGR